MTIMELLEMPTPKLKHLLSSVVGATNGDNYTYIPGSIDTPFMLVAHIDTVSIPKVSLKVTSNVVRNTCGPLGADDRAGIYAALKIYQKAVIKPHLLFTDLEERGGIGAKEVAYTLPCPDGVKLLIELDRRGCNEWVSYDPQHKKVKKYVEKFGFVEEFGTYSDIADIAPAWNKASVNLSVGYYDQHTAKERLHLDELELTIQRVLNMTLNPIAKDYPPPEDEYTGYCDKYYKEVGYADSWYLHEREWDSTKPSCWSCGQKPIGSKKFKQYEDVMLCPDCYEYYKIKDANNGEYIY